MAGGEYGLAVKWLCKMRWEKMWWFVGHSIYRSEREMQYRSGFKGNGLKKWMGRKISRGIPYFSTGITFGGVEQDIRKNRFILIRWHIVLNGKFMKNLKKYKTEEKYLTFFLDIVKYHCRDNILYIQKGSHQYEL